jgi:DNA-binding NtrC family response regulator
VVVVSADATTLQTQKALTGGALHYVTKPLDVGRFLKIVDDILEGVETRWG